MKTPYVFNRFRVVSVDKINYEQELMIEHLPSGKFYGCNLSGSWNRSKVFPGDIMNVISDKFDGKTFIVNDDHGLVTIDPDNLIPVGSIAKARTCMRKEWLARLFKMIFLTFDEPSTIGIIVRDIFQTACQQCPTTLSQLETIRKECFEKEDIIKKYSKVDTDKEELIKKVDEYLPCIMRWLEKYVLKDAGSLNNDGLAVQIGTVKDIEENIWSPSLGVKGKVIVSCEVDIHDRTPRKKLVPLAMRTGRAYSNYYSEHTDQSKLHSMMMRERGSEDCDDGLVLFLKNKKGKLESAMNLIKVNRHDETRLLQTRNELAYFLSRSRNDFIGPDFLEEKREKSCENCAQRFNCSLMAASFEKDKIDKSTKFRRNLIASETEHLSLEEIDFFKKWMMLTKTDWRKKGKESTFWNEFSSTREAKNLGFGNLVIQKSSVDQIFFTRADRARKTLKFPDELLGKRVTISEDEPHGIVPSKVALFFGCVTEVVGDGIKLTLDQSIPDSVDDVKLYRMDVVDHGDLPFFHYWNLSTLMSKKSPWIGKDHQRLRDCIIKTLIRNLEDRLSLKFHAWYLLDENEKRALRFLDQMGTYRLFDENFGSEETIVTTVRVLSKAEKSILITSRDSTTLNRVLSQLKNFGVDFFCFRMQSDCGADIKEYTVEHRIKKRQENKQGPNLKDLYREIKIAAVICSDIPYDPLLFGKTFDFTIILEANMIPLPVGLSPIFVSERFILIGNKGPKSSETVDEYEKQMGVTLGRSLFEILWYK